MTDTAARSVRFEYTNWRGETAERWATPSEIWWGKTDFHPKPQWLMTAFDHDKGAERDFALRDCRFVSGSEDTPDYTPIASFHFSMSKQDIDRYLQSQQEEPQPRKETDASNAAYSLSQALEDIRRLKDRPQNCRGPFIITNEDLDAELGAHPNLNARERAVNSSNQKAKEAGTDD